MAKSCEIVVEMLATETKTLVGHYKQITVFIQTEGFPRLPPVTKAVCALCLPFSQDPFLRSWGSALCLLPMWKAQSCFSGQCAHRGMRGSPGGLLPCWPGGLTQQHLEKAPHLHRPPVQNSSGPPAATCRKLFLLPAV